MSTPPPATKCPTCKKVGPWLATRNSAFCSRRCQLVDLGRWLGEEHRIAEELRPSHFLDPDAPNGFAEPTSDPSR